MKRKNLFCLFVAALILTFLALTFISLKPTSPKYLELYAIEDEHVGAMPYKICYLRWHGSETELKIWSMNNMKDGAQWNKTVNDGDTFTVKFPSFTGWVEFYYDHKEVIIHQTGELQEMLLP